MSQVRITAVEEKLHSLICKNTPIFMGEEPCHSIMAVHDTIGDKAQVRLESRGLSVRFTTETKGSLYCNDGWDCSYAGFSPLRMAQFFGGLSAVTTMLLTASPLSTYMRWLVKGKVNASPLFRKSPLYFTLEFTYSGNGTFPTPNLSKTYVRDFERVAVYEVLNMANYMNTIGFVGADTQTHADMVDKLITSHPLNRHVAFTHALAAQERWCVGLESGR